MLEHVTYHDLPQVLTEARTGPVFLPLVDVPAGIHLFESQCELAFDGPTEDLDIHILFAEEGTEAGAIPTEPLASGELYHQARGAPRLAWTGHLPDMPDKPGVLGIALPSGTLPVGTRLGSMLSYVRGRL